MDKSVTDSFTKDQTASADRIQDQLLDEFDLRQVETDHRIANSLQIAVAILMQECRQITDAKAAEALKAAAARLVSIARLHRTLCQAPPQNDVDLEHFLAPLGVEISSSIGARIDIHSENVILPGVVAAQLGTIVSEMAANAVKHATREGGAPVLTVEGDTNGLGEVRLRVYDDGPGFPEGFSLKDAPGIGMAIISTTVQRLGGYVYAMPRFGAYCNTGAGLEIILPRVSGQVTMTRVA